MIKLLTNSQLLQETKSAVKEEKNSTLRVLEFLKEIDSRKLFLELSYPNLFVFCTKVLGYTDAEAQIRVAAAGVFRELPEIQKSVEDGRLSLTNLSYDQR